MFEIKKTASKLISSTENRIQGKNQKVSYRQYIEVSQ